MEFEGAADLQGVPVADLWLILADPVTLQEVLPGCERILRLEDSEVDLSELKELPVGRDRDAVPMPGANRSDVEARVFTPGESYGIIMQVGVAGMDLNIRARLDVRERDFPVMVAVGSGGLGEYSFEMESRVEVEDNPGGSRVKWSLDSQVSGTIFKWGSQLANPIVKKVVNRLFKRIETLYSRDE